MSNNTSKYTCPKCGNTNIQTERRLDGFHHCMECWYSWKNGEAVKPTVFHRLTVSPDVLAEKLVYLVCSSYGGATNFYWRSTIIDKAWKTKAEAIAATAEELNSTEEKGTEND